MIHFHIKTLNSIASVGLERLPKPLFVIGDEADAPDGILVRSANMHDTRLPESLLAIARAGAGTNNIPVNTCSEKGIVVFNTPGANANAVKELVLGALVLGSRNVVGGIEWVKTLADKGDDIPKLVEKGKSQFAGPEFSGKTIGIIGLGAIGVKVANMATHLGMKVLGYDPFISIDAAWSLSRSVIHCVSQAEVINGADYISLHLPVTADTKNYINADTIRQMKPGVRIINLARGELVDDEAMLKALKEGRVGAYVTDFPNKRLVNQPGVECIPHLGASTPESEDNCAMMAADQLKDYLLNGNIVNSVNLPTVSQPRSTEYRVCVLHCNSKGLLAGLTNAMVEAGINIADLTNKSRGDYAYTLLDVDGQPGEAALAKIGQLEGVIRVRLV